MPKKQGFYSTGPQVPAKKMTGPSPFGTVPLGSGELPDVPTPTGTIHGLGPHNKPFRQSHVKGSHGFGHPAKHHEGKLRLSGYTDAHRLGAPKSKKSAPKVY
jgi:hypothetical protein